MQAIKLFHNFFKEKLPFIHKARLHCLMQAVQTLLMCNKLSLTSIGRNILNKCGARYNIKKVDRLLRNKHLQKEAAYIYKEMADLILKGIINPWILIDWSCLSSTTNLYMLRASIVLKGRSIVLFEEVHPKKLENNHTVHKKFLNQLRCIIPSGSIPIIVTDAGFRAPWFKYILSLGWHFVGRVRNKNLIQFDNTKEWVLSSSLYNNADINPTYLGEGKLTKEGKVSCHFVILKETKKNRKKLNKNNTKSNDQKSKKYSKSYNEPWLLVSSFKYDDNLAKKMVKIYKTRMQIEENIRDTKSQKFGFGLNESNTRIPKRMSILLLIAAIASFLCWLAGIQVKEMQLGPKFQAASSKFTSILSVVFLGKEALKRKFKITKKQFYSLIEILRSIVLKVTYEAC